MSDPVETANTPDVRHHRMDVLGTWGEYYQQDYTLPWVHEHLANMGQFIETCKKHFGGQRILEIGTGTGLLAIYFSQAGYEVTGMDSDRAVIAGNTQLNRRFHGRARFLVGDMFNLPFEADAFDSCYHQGLMEHFDEPEIVEALTLQLAVSRKLVFSVPTRMWRGGVFGNERMWSGAYWLQLLKDFRVTEVSGSAYASFGTRAMHFAGRRVTGYRPRRLFHHLALRKAGEICIVMERC